MIRVRSFSVRLESPLATASGSIEAREGFLLRVEDGDETGLGEAAPLPGWTESLDACRESLDAVRDVFAVEGVDAPAADLLDGPAARNAVSLARADLAARRADEPLYRHLGADRRVESVPVNATVGDADADETARRAADAVADGFDCVKVKVGARPVPEDVARLAAVRDAVGDGVELRADANAAWTRDQARRAFERFADVGVRFVEQPLAPRDLRGHADLRDGPVGVALDETLARVPLADALAADAADAVVLKPMVLGGVERARRAALRARDAGVTPVVTTTVDAVVARTAAVHLAASLPDPPACGLATASFLAEDLAPDPAPVEGGEIPVPQDKGHGAGAAWEE
jgi:o-succinylbenzoate synthase